MKPLLTNDMHEAITVLLREDSPERFAETQELFFEAWLASSQSDGTTIDQRATIYNHYKATMRFLKQIA